MDPSGHMHERGIGTSSQYTFQPKPKPAPRPSGTPSAVESWRDRDYTGGNYGEYTTVVYINGAQRYKSVVKRPASTYITKEKKKADFKEKQLEAMSPKGTCSKVVAEEIQDPSSFNKIFLSAGLVAGLAVAAAVCTLIGPAVLAVGFAYAALGASIGFSLGIIGGGISGAIQYHKANGTLEGASGDVIKSMSNWTPITTTIGAIAGAAFYAVTTYMAAQGAATVATDVAGEVVENVADDVVKEAVEVSKNLRNTPDQNAVLELAKEAKANGGVDAQDARTIMEWAKEYEVPYHGPERHLNRPQISSQNWHFHIGNSSKTGHIQIIGDILNTFGEVIK